MEFEWDDSKATANLTKHGVSFEEVNTVFDNVLAVIFDGEAHSVSQKREIIIGHSRYLRSLLLLQLYIGYAIANQIHRYRKTKIVNA